MLRVNTLFLLKTEKILLSFFILNPPCRGGGIVSLHNIFHTYTSHWRILLIHNLSYFKSLGRIFPKLFIKSKKRGIAPLFGLAADLCGAVLIIFDLIISQVRAICKGGNAEFGNNIGLCSPGSRGLVLNDGGRDSKHRQNED